MISERFLKLDENKRQRIFEASLTEFADAGYSEASINRIIKDAEISRGSFYTYFDDKKSIFMFILERIKDYAVNSVLDAVRKTNGDIFDACRYLIKKADKMNYLEAELTQRFIVKTFSDINSIVTMKGSDFAYDMLNIIYDNMNDLKEYMTKEAFEKVADLLVTISVKALVHNKLNPASKQKNIDGLFFQYEIIERGIRGGVK